MNKKVPQKITNFKYLALFGFLVLILGISVLIWHFNPEIQEAKKHKEEAAIFSQKIQEERNKYINDSYGGESPETTYQMFLEALNDQNIDLAVRYFVFDKQELYKQFFLDIKNNGRWEEMMEDLLNPENQKGEMKPSNSYVIRVYNKDNYLIAQATLKEISFSENGGEIRGSIWKMIEF
ncbi:MAG: hypothetical protein PHF45_01595 [Candidatus Pacebacteria bacterium]|nr:hypothetical protein [Candidatus Paceibacterota bacterium]